MGTETLDKAGLKMFRNKFMKIAEGMQQEGVKESALLMESITESALAEDQKKKKGRLGLQLVIKKIDKLVVKTKVAYVPLSKTSMLLCSSFHESNRGLEIPFLNLTLPFRTKRKSTSLRSPRAVHSARTTSGRPPRS